MKRRLNPIRVRVWSEYVQDRPDELIDLHSRKPDGPVQDAYPSGIHTAIAEGIAEVLGDEVHVDTATLHDPEHGLTEDVVNETDVLVWWGHFAHDDVDSKVVARVHDAVLKGLGLVVLHSAHYSRIFRQLMGTSCDLYWRDDDEEELVWTVSPRHPIAQGVPHPIKIPAQEMYGEYFDIPAPEELVFVSSFAGGEVFRSGCCFKRGEGRIFYFSPGHETAPIYYHPDVRRVIANGVKWAVAPANEVTPRDEGCPYVGRDWFRNGGSQADAQRSLVVTRTTRGS
jgi:trehalose utilization protein